MSLIPADWLPDSNARRVICHWTGGDYSASALDRQHYHILIERDGNLVRGLHTIADNDSTSDGKYAAHTLGTNTGSIGVAVCCMAGAEERPFKPGTRPMSEHQWEVMAEVVAELCRRYDIAVTPRTVLGHGEVQKNLGNRQRGKWDPLVLPWRPELAPEDVGEALRDQVRIAMDEPVAPESEVNATLTATLFDVQVPAASFNETAWLRVSDLVALLGWILTGADPKLVRLTTAEGRQITVEHCFADGGELEPGLDAGTCKELVAREAFIGAADLAHALKLPVTFLPDERRLVFGKPAREQEAIGATLEAAGVVVQPGDTLSGIAAKHLGDAKRWRELRIQIVRSVTDADAAALRPGQIILLPVPGPADVPAAKATATIEPEADGSAADVEILARTLWGEARGERTREGRVAIAAVILNRVKRGNPRRFGGTIAGVCQKKFQFSCWNPGDPNRSKLLAIGQSDATYKECLEIARAAAAGTLQDPTGGADHYHADSVRPGWARGRRPCKIIGNHLFYNDIP